VSAQLLPAEVGRMLVEFLPEQLDVVAEPVGDGGEQRRLTARRIEHGRQLDVEHLVRLIVGTGEVAAVGQPGQQRGEHPREQLPGCRILALRIT
jgi:hypothetical protein